MTNTTTAPRAIYAGIGRRETPRNTLADMTRMARWLHRTGWHLNTGGAYDADQAFVDGTPPGTRTRYLPWAGYNNLTGTDCHVLSDSERPSCTRLASQLHPTWHRFADGARRLLAPMTAVILGPALDRPVDAIVSWHPARHPSASCRALTVAPLAGRVPPRDSARNEDRLPPRHHRPPTRRGASLRFRSRNRFLPFVRFPRSSLFHTAEWLALAERVGSAATPTLMLKRAVPMIDLDSPLHSMYPGASLRDRATLSSPLRGLGPAGGYPSRLRSLRSLRAPLAGRQHAALDPRNSLSSDPITAILGACKGNV